jgi:hypothetical protein
VLPPVLGTRLSDGPFTSLSPRPPELVVTISSALETSKMNAVEPPPPIVEPTLMRVDGEPSLAIPAAGAAEDDHLRRHLNVLIVATGRRHGGDLRGEGRPGSRRGRAGQELGRQRCLTLGAGHVHHRRLARHRDGLGERAHPQVRVDGGGEGAGQLDAVALDAAEPLQRERQRIHARAEIDDPILAGAVGDGGPDLLDQRGARGFDGDARQHGAGRVFHRAGDGGLRASDGGERGEQDDGEQERRGNAHVFLSLPYLSSA